MVKVLPAVVLSGTFTVHASHRASLDTGHHQYSSIAPDDATDAAGQPLLQKVSVEEAKSLPRLGDGLHKLQFVGQGGYYAY
jgi:hypothetical protein